jgi:hypothetical protein
MVKWLKDSSLTRIIAIHCLNVPRLLSQPLAIELGFLYTNIGVPAF